MGVDRNPETPKTQKGPDRRCSVVGPSGVVQGLGDFRVSAPDHLDRVASPRARRNYISAMRHPASAILLSIAFLPSLLAGQAAVARAPLPAYKVGVVSESGDIVSWFIPDGPRLVPDRVVPVGLMPTDPDGPHNLAVSADGRWYYI